MIFLDLHKAYVALDRSRCLEILEGYGADPRARKLLRAYWGKMKMVERRARRTPSSTFSHAQLCSSALVMGSDVCVL